MLASRVNIKQQSVNYGVGAVTTLPDVLEKLEAKRVLVIVDPFLTQSRYLTSVTEACGDRLVGVWSERMEHVPGPVRENAAAAAEHAKADVVVTFGGGSTTDTGKGVKLLLSKSTKSQPRTAIRQIAFPTTLAGAEFTSSASVTDPATGRKSVTTESYLLPDEVFLDPSATLQTPSELWSSSGIKAIDHCVEGLYSITTNRYAIALLFEGFRILTGNLERSTKDPENMDARLECQVGSWFSLAGCTIDYLGVSHALGHVIGGLWHVPHGFTSCVTMPESILFNGLSSVPMIRRMVAALGLDIAGIDDSGCVSVLSEHIKSLIAGLGLPTRIRDIGGKREDLREIAERSMSQPIIRGNPRSVTADDLLGLLERAW